jgi:hypothetical protein
MGFDTETPLYHGTGKAFAGDFEPSKPAVMQALGEGVYATPDARFANEFAVGDQAAVFPLLGRGPFVPRDTFKAKVDAIEASLPPAKGANPSERWTAGLNRTEEAHRLAREHFQSQGFTGVVGAKTKGKASEVAIWDPKNIRSRFAKFDPANKDSSNLLAGLPMQAGIAGAGAAGAAMLIPPASQKRKKPPTS